MKTASLRDALKVSLLLAALSVDLFRWLSVWHEKGNGWDLTLMPKLFWVLAIVLIASAYIRNDIIRIGFAVLFAASTLLVQSTQMAIGVNVSYFDFVTIVDARSAFEDAVALHGRSMILSAIPAIFVLIGVGIRPRPIPRWAGWAAVLAPIFAIIGLSAVLHNRHGNTGGLPAPFMGLGYAALYGVDVASGNTGERQPVSLPQTGAQPVGDIVLIVDESVSVNHMDLANPNGARSALLEPNAHWTAANFGTAASITNCSMNSNVALRYGATRDRYQQIIATGPSIWAYAKKAGMRTIYLYGQRGGANENYVSDAERSEMDEAIYFEDHAPLNRDRMIAGQLAEYLNNDVSEFILINKYGVHFPLIGVVPGEAYDPNPSVITEALLASSLERRGGWANYKKDYVKALNWSVGGFFDHLSDNLAETAPPFTMIYTSDHGQAFNERGDEGINTHCTKDPAIEEGVVPIVVIDSSPTSAANWAAAADQGKNARSHYRIFPSLLTLMGYKPAEVTKIYGSDLLADESDPMTFGVEMHLRLGTPPRWKKIDPECVVLPDAAKAEATPLKC